MLPAALFAMMVLAVGVGGFSVDMNVPVRAESGAAVVLTAPYRLTADEHIRLLTWSKDGQVFLTYSQQPIATEAFDIDGITINREEGVTAERVVLQPEGDAAAGTYSLRVEVVTETDSGTSTSTYQHTRTLQVGGVDQDPLSTRFGSGSSARPADLPQTTFISQSTSAGSVPVSALGGGLGNRFGGNRESAAAQGVNNAGVGAQGFNTAGAGFQGTNAANQGLNGAINSLQQAVNQLNAVAQALNG